MLHTVVVCIVPLHSAFVLVVVFVLGIVFFLFSVSCSWFCMMLKKLYFIVHSCCGTLTSLPVRFVTATLRCFLLCYGTSMLKLVMESLLLVVGSVYYGCVCEMSSWYSCPQISSLYKVCPLCYPKVSRALLVSSPCLA
jgi:hypothetical protein